MIGPVQDVRPAVALHGIECHVVGVDQRARHRRRPATGVEPLAPMNWTVPFPVTDAVSVSPISASWTLSVPETGAAELAVNGAGRNIVDLECVRASTQDDLVELGQAGEFDIPVRRERTLVSIREQRRDVCAGIGSDKLRSIVEADRVVGIDRAPIKPKSVLLGAERDGLGAAAADAEIVGRVGRPRQGPKNGAAATPSTDPWKTAALPDPLKSAPSAVLWKLSAADRLVIECFGFQTERIGGHPRRPARSRGGCRDHHDGLGRADPSRRRSMGASLVP